MSDSRARCMKCQGNLFGEEKYILVIVRTDGYERSEVIQDVNIDLCYDCYKRLMDFLDIHDWL